MFKFVFLWTDVTVWALVGFCLVYGVAVVRSPGLSASWRRVFREAPAMCSAFVLALCLAVTVADSVHYRSRLAAAGGAADAVQYEVQAHSLLDLALADLVQSRETSYSRPLAYEALRLETVSVNGRMVRMAPRLKHGGAHLSDPQHQWHSDLLSRGFTGLLFGLGLAAATAMVLFGLLARARRAGFVETAASVWNKEGDIPWRAALWTLTVMATLVGIVVSLMGAYHVFGTDTTGNDVLYQALKSIRTAFVIGSLATIATLPLAVVLGIMAGYFRG
ncbi:MAG: ABC transporter permease, partial [Burkholderiaceae bacterium]